MDPIEAGPFITGGVYIGLLVWMLISAVVAASIAGGKGLNVATWFFATLLFLGPIGVGFALIASPGGDYEPGSQNRRVASQSASSGGSAVAVAVADAAPKKHSFKVGDHVEVNDPEHRQFGKAGTVARLMTTGFVVVKFSVFTEDVFDPALLKSV